PAPPARAGAATGGARFFGGRHWPRGACGPGRRGLQSALSDQDPSRTSPEPAAMPSHHSVSAWIEGLKAGDAAAAEELWQRYFGQLVALARRRLQGARVRAADGEDAALSAFDSFCRGAEQGRFPRLNDRDDLWQ